MQHLNNDFWLTSDPIDFEFKNYIMLAYKQKMMDYHSQEKLYPYFTDITEKLKYVTDFLKSIVYFENSAREVQRIDWLNQEIEYKSKINDNTFDELRKIATMSKDILSDLYVNFKNLYDEVDESMEITGSHYSLFNKYDGYIVMKGKGFSERLMKYYIYRVIDPEPAFHLKTTRPIIKQYYEERLRKNFFEVIVNDKYPAKETAIPVFRKKFIEHVVGKF
jgi:hypothetical protein